MYVCLHACLVHNRNYTSLLFPTFQRHSPTGSDLLRVLTHSNAHFFSVNLTTETWHPVCGSTSRIDNVWGESGSGYSLTIPAAWKPCYTTVVCCNNSAGLLLLTVWLLSLETVVWLLLLNHAQENICQKEAATA